MPYAEPPWIFKGRYTLGGFYLARYSDSPVGAFDELVVISGLVWNFPTSCAWAARVYVSNSDARKHGRKDVGLPSRLASFTEDASQESSWWHATLPGGRSAKQAASNTLSGERHTQAPVVPGGDSKGVIVRNTERRHWSQPWRRNTEQLQEPVCKLNMPDEAKGWKGPRLKMSLPSFSGNTAEHPGLLQYACQLMTNVRPISPARVHMTPCDDSDPEVMAGVLGGRPVLALSFDNMEMKVHAPVAYMLKTPQEKQHSQQISPAV